jgi:ATP-dependent DNA helicase RecQ
LQSARGRIATPLRDQSHVSDSVRSELKRRFGFEAFRPGQEAVVRDALAGRDLLAIMPTGGGKSLCFQLPALLRPGVMLVVSPLIALMQDQVRLLTQMDIPAAFLNSSLSAREGAQVMERALRGEIRLLYLAPERLLMAEFLDGFIARLKQTQGLSALTIDEAHCVSEWGHDFRPEYRQLGRLREHLPDTPVFAFTATATERVRRDIALQLRLQDPALHVASFNRPNLYYAVRPKAHKAYPEIVTQARRGGAGIVYCLSRKRVEEIAARLSADGLRALPYHAGLDAETRRANQDAFIRDDAQVIVATVAFGMGINKPDVRWVVHYDLPKTMEGYYQEASRAGRDGEPARCTLYFGPGDIRTAEFLIEQKQHPETGAPLVEEQRIARQQLRQVVDYAESAECRRAVQLRYFGEAHGGACGACDNCTNPKPVEDWTREAQQFLSCVARLAQRGEHYGAGTVIDILRGVENERIIDRGHQQLSTYGIGTARSKEEWRHLARALVHQGLLAETSDGYPVLRLVAESRPVLKGERPVRIAAAEKAVRTRRRDKSAVVSELPTDQAPVEALFERLRGLRKRLADEQRVPPYHVFTDASLRQMAEQQPGTAEAFGSISGVGARKLAQYGPAFTAAIREFRAEQGLALGAVSAAAEFEPADAPGEAAESSESLEATRALYERGLDFQQIAERRGLTVATVIQHIERLLILGTRLDLSRVLPPERMQRIAQVLAAEGYERLRPAFERLGGECSYEELRLVRGWLRGRPGAGFAV